MTAFRLTAAMLVVTGLSTAQAAETTLLLACKGTATYKPYHRSGEYQPKPISMGLIVNFTTQTVRGATDWITYAFGEDTIPITTWNEVKIDFNGVRYNQNVSGSMDRVTGDVGILVADKGDIGGETEYSLKCTPTERKF